MIYCVGELAHLVERRLCKAEVIGSSPIFSTRFTVLYQARYGRKRGITLLGHCIKASHAEPAMRSGEVVS